MSSDKAPEKLYYDFIADEVTKTKISFCHTYIREDLTLDAKLKEPGSIIEYETEKQLEEIRKTVGGNIKDMERRREMFEKVAVVCIAQDSGFSWKEIAKIAEELLEKSDKFARGEK